MANRYDSGKKTIGELLSLTSPRIQVPDFQRNFCWDTSAVETFWQDLLSFSGQYPDDNVTDQEYFLGSIVLVDNGPNLLLLDGQQRLATATILLSVIRDHLHIYSKDAATRTAQKYITEFDDATETNAFKLTMNQYDREFFRREIQEFPRVEPAPSPAITSHNLIRRARDFFAQRFQAKYQELGEGKNAFDWALRVRKVLTDHVSVVAVTSTDEDNAATVFETLNDRGIGLSTPDLLRNFLLRRAGGPAREEIIDCWREVLEMEDEAKVEDFLRHYWLSHRGDVKTRSLYREIKRTLEQEQTDSLAFSRDLHQAANVYRDLVAGRDEDPDLQRLLENVNMLGARSLLPAILSAYAVGTLEQKIPFLRALICLFVRHNAIGNLENSRLENVVFNLAKDLRQNRDFGDATRRTKEAAPPDAEFVRQFKTAQVSRRDSARYMLRELEHAMRETQEVEVEAPDRVHVEHIYPQNPLAGQRWDSHGLVVDRLGNLTLLSKRLNTQIRNSDFATKRPSYEKSDLLLSQELAQYESWNPETIDDRQEKMSDLAASIWALPG